jgi:hypothetical protein
MKKALIAVALAFVFTANISASSFNPVYLPEAKEAFLKSELRYISNQTETGESGNSKDLDLFGGTWGDSFDFGYGISDKLTFRVARTPINSIYNLLNYYTSTPALGLTYRVMNSGLTFDLLADWGIALAKHTDEDYPNSPRIKTEEEANAFHLAARLGKKGEKFSFAGTAGVIYVTPSENEYIQTSGVLGWLNKLDSRTDYYLKLNTSYNMSERMNLGGAFVYSQIGEQELDGSGIWGATDQTRYEDQKPHMYFEVSGDYQLKENVNIQTFLGYTPEVKTGTSKDNNDFVNAGVRFGFNF